jgi:ActR/RegA family two-component response regulator
MPSRPRIVVATPHAMECASVADWLHAEGFEPVRATTVSRALQELNERPFSLLVADYDFAFRGGLQAVSRERMRNAKAPGVVLGPADPAAEALAVKCDAMYLSRPVEQAALVCMVQMAMLESRPERRSVRKPVRFDAIVGGVPAHLIDISKEGMRLEIPRTRNAAPPPPLFTVRVALIGVNITVRRMWASPTPKGGDIAWYGGELAANSGRVELAWRSFVDAMPNSGTALEYR